MRGPGGNDDVEGYGPRKITSGVLFYKSLNIGMDVNVIALND